MDRLSVMAAFSQVLASGGFSKAARVLGVTPSSVSKSVARLEGRLGVKLLVRSTHGMTLTDEGRQLHERIGPLLDALSHAEELISDRPSEPTGQVRIGTLYGIGRWLVVPAVAELRARHPRIDIELHLAEALPSVMSDGPDIAITLGEPARTSRLVCTKVAATRLVTVASPAYLAAHGKPQTPAELDRHECLLHRFHGQMLNWSFRQRRNGQSIVHHSPRGQFTTNTGDVMREAAVAGLGLAQSNSLLFQRDLDAGSLVEVLEPYAVPGLPVCILRAPLNPMPSRIRAVHELLCTRIAAHALPRQSGRAKLKPFADDRT